MQLHQVFMYSTCANSGSKRKREDTCVNFEILELHVEKLFVEL